MKHGEFRIGATFWCVGNRWRCTDIGTRTIVAIRLHQVEVQDETGPVRTLGFAEAEAEGWFHGPPYAVAEHVFDEEGIIDCTVEPEETRGCLGDKNGAGLLLGTKLIATRAGGCDGDGCG
jgi:hypothetical protein